MNMRCLNCGSENTGQRLPCSVCGSLLFAPASDVLAVVHFDAPITTAEDALTVIDEEVPSAPAIVPLPHLVATRNEIVPAAPAIAATHLLNHRNVLILSGIGAILLIIGLIRFGVSQHAPQEGSGSREQASVHTQQAPTKVDSSPKWASPAPQLSNAVDTASSADNSREVQTPGVKVGDRWLLRSDDLNNPKWSNVTERTVVSALDAQLIVTSRNTRSNYTRKLVFSPDWNLLQTREPDGRGFDYSPPLKYFDFPLFPGKTWGADIEEISVDQKTRRRHQLSATVDGWEEVTVPAGTFKALKITLKVRASEGSAVTRESTDVSWYAPKAKRSIKTEETSVNVTTGERTNRQISLMEFAVTE